MKNLVMIFIALLLVSQNCFGASSNITTLNKIEDSLYGFRYSNEAVSTRLNRIEDSVYGQKFSSKSENERIAKLSKDMSVDSIGKEIPPVEDTFAQNSDYIFEDISETSDVSYPVIDEMEQIVFNNVNKTDKIQARLSKLEQKTFNKTYNDDLSTRVDRLRAEIKVPQNRLAQSPNVYYDDDMDSFASNYHLDKYVPPGSFDYEMYNDLHNRYNNTQRSTFSSQRQSPQKVSLSSIEKKIFKKTYTNDTMENRLSRIENSMFGSEFTSDDTQTRIDRVSSAFKAEKSSGRYDSNKFAQNMATAMQIGTLILMVLACIL